MIQNQLDLLEMLQMRHTTWLSENLDFEIRQAHNDIIDLLGQAVEKYVALLKLYDKKSR